MMTGVNIKQNLEAAQQRIAAAAERADRDPTAVRLIAVTKTHPVETIIAGMEAGLTDLGENRVQEALPKIDTVESWRRENGRPAPTWHLIGHLQTNKVKAALGGFAILHSLDSLKLANALDGRVHRTLPVFIEVNVAGESTKHGFAPHEVGGALGAIGQLPRLNPLGLMTVAPQADDETVRKVFRELRELAAANGLSELSMGMSDDFEIAVEEGATYLRLGRVLFGEWQ